MCNALSSLLVMSCACVRARVCVFVTFKTNENLQFYRYTRLIYAHAISHHLSRDHAPDFLIQIIIDQFCLYADVFVYDLHLQFFFSSLIYCKLTTVRSVCNVCLCCC